MNDLLATLASAPPLPDWAMALRSGGAEKFRQFGLPHVRLEAWKYTSLKPMAGRLEDLDPAPPASPGAPPDCSLPGTVLDLAEGVLLPVQETPAEGVSVTSLPRALAADDPVLRDLLVSLPADQPAQALSALNTAAMLNGVVVRVDAGVDAGRVVAQWFSGRRGAGHMANSRVCLLLGAGARLEWVDLFRRDAGDASTLNLVVQAQLGHGAELRFARLQDDGVVADLLTRTVVRQAAASSFEYTGLDLGGQLARHDIECLLEGDGARCELSGAYLPRDEGHVDNHLSVEHRARDCSSRQRFRGVLRGRSRAVFNGRAHVHPGADGSNVYQSNDNLLLSELAEIDTKPELQIEADEVVASHGATVGQLDETAVFYLRSRGLKEEQARSMLTSAFCRSVVDEMPAGPVREAFAQRLDAALEGQ